MKTLLKTSFLCFLAVFLASCGCNYHLKKVKAKCGYTQDTVYKTVTVTTEKVERDTVFHYDQRDTVIIREGKLTVKYHYNNHDSTVYVTGKCDPEIIETKVPVVVNKYRQSIAWTWIILAAMGYALLFFLFRKR